MTALTDEAEAVVESYTYRPFGELKRYGSSVMNSYTFTGREWDEETGLYYYRARYYDPEVGKFISYDPILRGINHTGGSSCSRSINTLPLTTPQELNGYVYVGNNPVNFVDPMGSKSKKKGYSRGDLCIGKIKQRINTGSCPDEEDCFICCAELSGELSYWPTAICEGLCVAAMEAYKKKTGICCNKKSK